MGQKFKLNFADFLAEHCPNSKKGGTYESPPDRYVPNSSPAKNLRSVQRFASFSGLQKGPAERGHVKKRQKSSKSVKKFFDTFRHFSRRAKNVKNRQKTSKSFSTLFDNFHAAPFFRPLLGGVLPLVTLNPTIITIFCAIAMVRHRGAKWEVSGSPVGKCMLLRVLWKSGCSAARGCSAELGVLLGVRVFIEGRRWYHTGAKNLASFSLKHAR